VTGISGVTAIAAGGWHTCAILSGGSASCWGQNDWGQLGNGTRTDSPVPRRVSGIN
jgi:alpha-tubulin suppressor-like RCC1 family protein